MHCPDTSNLCDDCAATLFEQLRGTVYSRAETMMSSKPQRLTPSEMRAEARAWVRDLTGDPKVLQRLVDEFICWVAVTALAANASSIRPR